MNGESLRIILLVALATGAVVVFIGALLFPISGQFRRVDNDEDDEVVEFASLGPYVRGTSTRPGGRREYSGWTAFGRARIDRRDHGQALLEADGYPSGIARRRDGEVAAKWRVRRVGGGRLEVAFASARVAFTHQPPRVTGVDFLQTKPRLYVRVDDVNASEA